MRHTLERRPANLRRSLPQWGRSPTQGGVEYRILIPAGQHTASVTRMVFPASTSRKQIAEALRKARAHHAGWDKRPKRPTYTPPTPLDSPAPPAAPIAPPEMAPTHDASEASSGQLLMF